jgi:hypothetical protein
LENLKQEHLIAGWRYSSEMFALAPLQMRTENGTGVVLIQRETG